MTMERSLNKSNSQLRFTMIGFDLVLMLPAWGEKNQILSWNRNPQLSEMNFFLFFIIELEATGSYNSIRTKPTWNCFKYCIYANNCHNNDSFLKVKCGENLYIVIVIILPLCFNVAETIKGGKLFKWRNYSQKYCTSKIISLTALYL